MPKIESQNLTSENADKRATTGTDLDAFGKRGLDVYDLLSQPMSIRIDEVGTTEYYGFAPVGSSESSAVWQIKRLTVSGAITSITFADGDSNFDNVWDNRASLTYS